MKTNKAKTAIIAALILICANCTPAFAFERKDTPASNRTAEETIASVEMRMAEMQSASSLVVVSTYEELKAAVDAKAGSIHIANDIQLEDALNIDYDVYFSASGVSKTLFSAPEKRHILAFGGNLQLQFNNVILNGNYKSNNVSTGGIDSSAENLTLVNPVINNCFADSMGGGLCTDSDTGSFTLYGGNFANNEGTFGGGIATNAKNVLLYDSVFDGNKTSGNSGQGGAVCFNGKGTPDDIDVKIYNTEIMKNTSGFGGGIYIGVGKLFLDEKTVIRNNKASIGGGIFAGGLCVADSYSIITENRAINGAGVRSNHIFTMNGGEISYNVSTNSGGGVCVYYNAVFTVNDGVISNNSAAVNGGGIGFVTSGSTKSEVHINGGTVEKNQALNGAGVYAIHFSMTDGTLQDNGYYEDENGEITAGTNCGGGVYAWHANITGGFIYSNMAENGGGLYIEQDGSVVLNSPAYVRYNEAADKGGGAYLCKNAVYSDMDTARIRNNSAGSEGAQYYIVPADTTA